MSSFQNTQPQRVALQKRIAAETDAVLLHAPQLALRQRLLHRSGDKLRAKRPVRDLDWQARRLKQLVVAEIGLNEPALDAAFKNAGKNQAERHGHVSRDHPDPVRPAHIRDGIAHRHDKRNERQPTKTSAVRNAAVAQDHRDGNHGAQKLPHHHEEIPDLVAIILI